MRGSIPEGAVGELSKTLVVESRGASALRTSFIFDFHGPTSPSPKPHFLDLYLCVALPDPPGLLAFFPAAESDVISATGNREYASRLYYSPLFDPEGLRR